VFAVSVEAFGAVGPAGAGDSHRCSGEALAVVTHTSSYTGTHSFTRTHTITIF